MRRAMVATAASSRASGYMLMRVATLRYLPGRCAWRGRQVVRSDFRRAAGQLDRDPGSPALWPASRVPLGLAQQAAKVGQEGTARWRPARQRSWRRRAVRRGDQGHGEQGAAAGPWALSGWSLSSLPGSDSAADARPGGPARSSAAVVIRGQEQGEFRGTRVTRTGYPAAPAGPPGGGRHDRRPGVP